MWSHWFGYRRSTPTGWVDISTCWIIRQPQQFVPLTNSRNWSISVCRHAGYTDDLSTYDFIWSSCSLEHLGSLELGEQFIYNSLKHLKPGGVCPHDEYNAQSILHREKGAVSFIANEISSVLSRNYANKVSRWLDFTREHALWCDCRRTTLYRDVHLKLRLDDYIAIIWPYYWNNGSNRNYGLWVK
jgi:hypothetical protein